MDKRKKDINADVKGGSFYASKGEERLAVALILVLGLLITTFTFHPQMANALSATSSIPNSYNCPDGGHCYGVNDWPGHVGGAFTAVDVVHLTPGNGVVDNELWIADTNLQCQLDTNSGQTSYCDVEGGYVDFSSTAETWFWVDIRPNGGYYHEHDSPPLQKNDYGNVADVTLTQNGVAGQWSISISGGQTTYTGLSTNNPISMYLIQMGQELGGTSGVNSPKATFQDNEWESTGGAWNYQPIDGTIDSMGNPNNPPWAGWDQGHDPAHYPYGGVFYTFSH